MSKYLGGKNNVCLVEQVLILFIINFITLFCAAQNEVKDNIAFKNVLTREDVQSAAFHVYNKDLYIAYVTRGAASSTLWVSNIVKKTSWHTVLDINGVWDLTGHNNSFILGGEDGNLHIINLDTKKRKVIKSPFKKEKPVVSIASGGDVVYAGTYKHGLVFAYNTKTGKYILQNKESYFSGESYIRTMAYSKKNHSLYMGTGTKAILGTLDLSANKVKRNFTASHEGYNFVYGIRLLEDINGNDYVFCRLTGKGERKSMLYNISKSKSSDVFEAVDIGSVIKDKNDWIFFSTSSIIYRAEIKNNTITNRKEIGKTRGAIIASYLFNNKVYYMNVKGGILSFDTNTYKAENQSLDFGKENKSEIIKLNTLYFDSDGFLWTSGFRTGDNAMINVKNGEKKVLKGIDQAEIIFPKGNKLYLGEYPDAKLYVYDKDKEWNKDKGNPKLITQIIGQDRIVTAATSRDLPDVYFGTIPEYGKLGGALLIVKPNEKVEVIKPYKDLSIVSLFAQDKLLYGGTSISGGFGAKPIAKEGKLFIYDPSKKKIIYEAVPVKGEIAITALTKLDKNRIVGIAGGTLFVFSISAKKVEKRIEVYKAISKTDITIDADLIYINDKVYVSSRRGIFCVNLSNNKVEKLYAKGTCLTFDGKNTFYYLEGGDIKSFKLK
ncbi:hypothetical protein D3C87_187370 [compost metagenome]